MVTKVELAKALSEFCENSCPRVANDPKMLIIARPRWKKNSQNNFEPRTGAMWAIQIDSVPGVDEAVKLLEADEAMSGHFDKLVGARHVGSMRIDAKTVLLNLIIGSMTTEPPYEFSQQRFDRQFDKIYSFFYESTFEWTLCAPIPGITNLPIKLDKNIDLVRFEEDEVERLEQVGLLHSTRGGFSVIIGDVAVGIRVRLDAQKTISSGDDDPEFPDPDLRPGFGHPVMADRAIADEVLSVLRLTGLTKVRCTGSGSFVSAPMIGGGIHFFSKPYDWSLSMMPRTYVVQEEKTQALWRSLKGGIWTKHPSIRAAIQRFNLALDRYIDEDRLVDLIVAAEALFLPDSQEHELKYRLSLRAAKLSPMPETSEHDLFDRMKLAYDLRSGIVHTGAISRNNIKKLGDQSLREFVDDIEEILRLSILELIKRAEAGENVGEPCFWNGMILDG